MSVFDLNGNIIDKKPMFVGVVMDASSEANRFLAMKQLYDIGMNKLKDPTYTPSSSEFTYATKGIVCSLPTPSAFYEQYDLDILYSKNATTQSIPASTTKIMTLIAGLPYVTSIKEKITLVSGDIESGSGNYFSAGDVLTVEDIIYGMLLPSSNTCAKAFAHYCGAKILGDTSASVSSCVEAFVAEMNTKATLIGCTGSTFTSPSGYDNNNVSTVKDLLRITIEAASFTEIVRVWNKKTYTIYIGGTNARTQDISTTVANETLEANYYIFGGKTGHISGNADALVMIAGLL